MASHEYMATGNVLNMLHRTPAEPMEQDIRGERERYEEVQRTVSEAPSLGAGDMDPRERSRKFIEWLNKRAQEERENTGRVVLTEQEDLARTPATLSKEVAAEPRMSERMGMITQKDLRHLIKDLRHFADIMKAISKCLPAIMSRLLRAKVTEGLTPAMQELLDEVWAVHRNFLYNWLSNRRWHRRLGLQARNLHWMLLTHLCGVSNFERTWALRQDAGLTLARAWPDLLEHFDLLDPKLQHVHVLKLSQDQLLTVLDALCLAWKKVPTRLIGVYPWFEKRQTGRKRQTEARLLSTPGSIWALLDAVQLRVAMMLSVTYLEHERDLDFMYKEQTDPVSGRKHRVCVPAYIDEVWARLEGMMLQLEVLQFEFFGAMGVTGSPMEMPATPGAQKCLVTWATRYSAGGLKSQLNTILTKGLWDVAVNPGDRERYQVFMASNESGARAMDDGNQTVMSVTCLEFNETAKEYGEMAATDVWDLSPVKPLAAEAKYLMTREALRLAIDGATKSLPITRWLWELANSGDTRRMEESEATLGATMERFFISADNVGHMQSIISTARDRAIKPGVPFRAIVLHALGSWLLVVPTTITRRKIKSNAYAYPDLASAVNCWLKMYEKINPTIPMLRAAVFRGDYSARAASKDAALQDVFEPGVAVSNLTKDPRKERKAVFSDNSEDELGGDDIFDAF